MNGPKSIIARDAKNPERERHVTTMPRRPLEVCRAQVAACRCTPLQMSIRKASCLGNLMVFRAQQPSKRLALAPCCKQRGTPGWPPACAAAKFKQRPQALPRLHEAASQESPTRALCSNRAPCCVPRTASSPRANGAHGAYGMQTVGRLEMSSWSMGLTSKRLSSDASKGLAARKRGCSPPAEWNWS